MAEPKLLPPSMREPKRYIVFEVMSENTVSYNDLMNAAWSSMVSFIGELGSSESNVWIIQNLYDEKAQRGVIKCKHTFVEQLRVGLSLVQYIGETKSIIKILGVTGTIRSAKNKYLAAKNLLSYGDSNG